MTKVKQSMQPLYTYIDEALRKLGKGEEGTVYDLGNGRVKKVFSRGRVPIPWQLLYQACQAGVEIEDLPKVFEVGDDYIIREDCKPMTEKCKKYWKVITWKPFTNDKRQIWQMVRDGEWWMDFETGKGGTHIRMATPGLTGEVIDWLLRLQYELSQVCGPTVGLGDFALKNLGETKDGRIVMIDF